jgi:hypothetical protein
VQLLQYLLIDSRQAQRRAAAALPGEPGEITGRQQANLAEGVRQAQQLQAGPGRCRLRSADR